MTQLNPMWGPLLNDLMTWQESASKTELEAMCLAEAGHWFTQASHTPFLQSPLLVPIFTEANISTKALTKCFRELSNVHQE